MRRTICTFSCVISLSVSSTTMQYLPQHENMRLHISKINKKNTTIELVFPIDLCHVATLIQFLHYHHQSPHKQEFEALALKNIFLIQFISHRFVLKKNIYVDFSRSNTAFITFINHNIKSSKDQSIMTLAHEVGHSFGAHHDEDTSCNSLVRRNCDEM